MVQFHGLPLVGRQAGQCYRQPDQLPLPNGLLARGGLGRRQPFSQPGGRCFDRHFQGSLPVHIACGRPELADFISQVVGQDLPEPRGPEGRVPVRKLGQGAWWASSKVCWTTPDRSTLP